MIRWTPKIAVANSRRNLKAAAGQLRKVCAHWEDVDQAYVDEAEQLIGQLEEFSERIESDIKERLALGEQIGL